MPDINIVKTAATAILSNSPESFSERAMFALKNTVLGLVMVFAVLSVLYVVVRVVSAVLGGESLKKRGKRAKGAQPAAKPTATVMPQRSKMTYIEEETDGEEIIAAISAAVAAVLESEGKDPRGFRVVSFKRSGTR